MFYLSLIKFWRENVFKLFNAAKFFCSLNIAPFKLFDNFKFELFMLVLQKLILP